MTILDAPPLFATPSLQAGNVTRNAPLNVVTMFNRTYKIPVIQPIITEPQRLHKAPTTKKTYVPTVETERVQRVKNVEKKCCLGNLEIIH